MKHKHKLKYKKIKRNILIIAFFIISILYINFMNNYTNKNLKSVQAFTEYAIKNNIPLTQEHYKQFINK